MHAYSNSQRNILYPGSPVSTSFHRTPIKNGVIIFDTETLEHDWIDLELPQLIRKTVSNIDDAIPTDFDHTIYEIEGNIAELGNIDTAGEHIDKMVVKKDTEKSLDLEGKTIEEELALYLREVLQFNTEQVTNVVSTFHEYTKEVEC